MTEALRRGRPPELLVTPDALDAPVADHLRRAAGAPAAEASSPAPRSVDRGQDRLRLRVVQREFTQQLVLLSADFGHSITSKAQVAEGE